MKKNTCSKCRKELESSRKDKYRYCKSCHAEWMRHNRPKLPEMSEESRKKANARSYSKVLVKRGIIKRESCDVCGDTNSEMHHDDYNDKINVRWMCRKHHEEWHALHKTKLE